MEYTDIVFKCRKCSHLVFVDNNKITPTQLTEISKMDCDSCGEDGYENWVLVRAGNYNLEYGEGE